VELEFEGAQRAAIVPGTDNFYTLYLACCFDPLGHCLPDGCFRYPVDDNFKDPVYAIRNLAAGDLTFQCRTVELIRTGIHEFVLLTSDLGPTPDYSTGE
jgi:hypothetical protein